ncbi:uncharacterized protein LOC108253747 isoform X1 [Diaphorina citri]|uniref:Uncharacterized protein LOC108253747 isoform X1 n=1 Tax=Diaphorina citri TaxID=121845 RepID=A0A1S4ENP4_DIACI|nr:uncharacterized protein LOC108253747 isoform X1 [Diaphorina citri]
MCYKSVVRRFRGCLIQIYVSKWTLSVILISILIHYVVSLESEVNILLKAERALDRMFEKMKTLQKNKIFLRNKLYSTAYSANDLDDELAMMRIEVSNFPNHLLHSEIFKITKDIARRWGIFNENDIADMYVYSKNKDRSDKNVIMGFKTMTAKRKWLSEYKKLALRQGFKSLKGFQGVPVHGINFYDGYKRLNFNVKMLDHVSRYKAFLMSVCLGKAKTIHKSDKYRFWVNNSKIYGVYKNAGGVKGNQVKNFMIHCFDDVSREIT